MSKNGFKRYRIWFVSVGIFLIGLGMLIVSILGEFAPEVNTYKEIHTINFALCGDMEMQKIMDEVVQVFMRIEKCEVDVYCFSTEEELREKVIAQVAAGEPFDVICPDRYTYNILKSTGHLCALDEIIMDLQAGGDSFYSAALANGQMGEKHYALPTGVMPYLIYYNQDAFEAAGISSPQEYMNEKRWTPEGFVECISRLYQTTRTPVLALSLAKDKNKIIPTTIAEIVGEDIEVDPRCIAYMDVSEMQKRFVSGEIPMIVSDLTMTRIGWDMQWDVIPYPSPESDFSRCIFEVPMIVVANSAQQELARKFAHFYVSAIGQKLRLEYGECLLPSLNMTFYTSMGDVVFPNHSNYYFFAIENGRSYEE